MKQPRYSRVFAIGSGFMVLLFTAGLLATRNDPPGLRLTTMRAAGMLLGVWILGQLFVKGSVTVRAWEVKGFVAGALAGLGALLGCVSAYCLFTAILRE